MLIRAIDNSMGLLGHPVYHVLIDVT